VILRTLQFFLLELTSSLKRNTVMTVASVTTVAVLIFLSGFFLILFMNLEHFKQNIASEMEIHAYLKPAISQQNADELKRQILSFEHVVSVTYVSQDEALSRLRADLKNQIDLSGIMQNPLPAYLSVKVKDPEAIVSVAEQIEPLKGIADVNYLQKIIEQFISVYKTAERLFLGLVIFILLCSLIIIHNTIRLGVFGRKNEIEIMQLVGASRGIIRWPFILEGAFYGFLGAFVAVCCLLPSVQALSKKFAMLFPLFPLITPGELWEMMALLLMIGIFVGGSGSYLSVNRYLE